MRSLDFEPGSVQRRTPMDIELSVFSLMTVTTKDCTFYTLDQFLPHAALIGVLEIQGELA